MEIIQNSVSERKLINEMDAPELLDYVTGLQSKVDARPLTENERIQILLAKANYKQITGRPMTIATTGRK